MENTLYCNEQFTFHASWLKAMQFIKSQSVRNRLVAAIVEYGLTRVHNPIGNPVADAIFTLVIDRIDRESPRAGEKSADTDSTQDINYAVEECLVEESSVDESSAAADMSDRPCSPLCDSREAVILPDEASASGDNTPPIKIDGGGGIRRKPKSKKKKRQARRRKHRR